MVGMKQRCPLFCGMTGRSRTAMLTDVVPYGPYSRVRSECPGKAWRIHKLRRPDVSRSLVRPN